MFIGDQMNAWWMLELRTVNARRDAKSESAKLSFLGSLTSLSSLDRKRRYITIVVRSCKAHRTE